MKTGCTTLKEGLGKHVIITFAELRRSGIGWCESLEERQMKYEQGEKSSKMEISSISHRLCLYESLWVLFSVNQGHVLCMYIAGRKGYWHVLLPSAFCHANSNGSFASEGRWRLFLGVCFFSISWMHSTNLCTPQLPTDDDNWGELCWVNAASTADIQAGKLSTRSILWPYKIPSVCVTHGGWHKHFTVHFTVHWGIVASATKERSFCQWLGVLPRTWRQPVPAYPSRWYPCCPPNYSRHRGRWLAERKLFPLVHDREMLGYYDKIFKLGWQLTAVVNNLGVLGLSLDIAPSKAPLSCPPRFFALLSISQINNLVIATAITLATVGSRHMWLGLMAFPKVNWDGLFGAPVLMSNLFGSISSVAQHLKTLEEESTQIRRHLPLVHAQKGSKGMF